MSFNISCLGKQDLADLGLNFVSMQVPAMATFEKTYFVKSYWFLRLDDIKKECKDLDPLILFDTPSVYNDKELKLKRDSIPKQIIDQGYGYMVRGIIDIPPNEWVKIIRNYFDPEDMIITYELDFEHYSHPEVERLLVKKEKQEEIAKEYDQKQLDILKNEKKLRQERFLRNLKRK
jgi:hypothetical protein